ncbi:MAG: hypothetical protein GXP62_05865 [Oligoflexia bacterium]|nr:hypothetical protein [Oligoflexia bacterium]
MRAVIQDGELRGDGRVLIDIDDQGLTRGLCAFETFRTYGGQLHHLDAHLERLTGSAAALRLPMPDRRTLSSEVARAVASVASEGEGIVGGEVVVRITLTEGSRIVYASPLPVRPNSLRVVTLRHPDHPWLSGRVKHTSRAASVVALRAAGVDEVLWVDGRGALLEGTWSNVLAVVDGAIRTPPDDGRILAGVTRGLILRVAADLGLPCQDGPLYPTDPMDELYCSSSLKQLCPIVELDGKPAAGAGPVGQAVLAAFIERLQTPVGK